MMAWIVQHDLVAAEAACRRRETGKRVEERPVRPGICRGRGEPVSRHHKLAVVCGRSGLADGRGALAGGRVVEPHVLNQCECHAPLPLLSALLDLLGPGLLPPGPLSSPRVRAYR